MPSGGRGAGVEAVLGEKRIGDFAAGIMVQQDCRRRPIRLRFRGGSASLSVLTSPIARFTIAIVEHNSHSDRPQYALLEWGM